MTGSTGRRSAWWSCPTAATGRLADGSEPTRQRHLEPLSTDLDHHALPPRGHLAGNATAGIRRDAIVELGLDPAGVNGEGRLRVGGREGRIVESVR